MENAARIKALSRLLAAGVFLTFPIVALSQVSRARPRGAQTKHSLTAEDIARKYLPWVVLITCDDAKGDTIQASGFFISRGLIVTNYHVIEGMVRGQVKLAPRLGRKLTILPINSILDFDHTRDLALLSVNLRSSIDLFLENESIPTIAPFDEPIRVGEMIYALGNPQGLEGSISEGIVSGIRQSGGSRLLQITTPISPGSSGGPVINAKGHVIGVVAASLREGQNLNFAIPSESVRKLVPRFVGEDYRLASPAPGAWKIPSALSIP